MTNKLLTIAALVFGLWTLDFGQTPSPAPAGFSDNQPEKPHVRGEVPKTLDEMKAAAKAAKHDGDLIFAWDKFSDTGKILSKPENIVGSWEGAGAIMMSAPRYGTGPGTPRLIMVSVETQFPGKSLAETPTKFALMFSGMSPDWQFLKSGDTLYLLLDDKDRIQLEAAASGRDVVRGNRVDESIGYVISRDDLARVAAAKTAELRIGQAKPRKFNEKLLRHFQAILDATKLDPVKE